MFVTGSDAPGTVIEVADSSLRYDGLDKAPRYARSSVPEMWLVAVEAGAVTVHTDPGPDGYASRRVLRRGDQIVSTSVPELGFPVDDVFSA